MTRWHSIWDEPPADAQPAVKQAYRQMMQILTLCEPRIPGVITEPEMYRGTRVMDAAIGHAVTACPDRLLCRMALDMLQRRIRTWDPELPLRAFLPPPPERHPIASDFGAQLLLRESFAGALDAFVAEKRPFPPGSAGQLPDDGKSSENTLDADATVGLLLALLILRGGQCFPPLLSSVVEQIDRPLHVAGDWCWVDITVAESRTAPTQRRRLLLDAIRAAAWLRAADAARDFPGPPAGSKASAVRRFYRSRAQRCFKALVAHLESGHPGLVDCTLTRLCAAEEQFLRVETLPVLATYAAGGLASSSLDPGCWARLLGCRLPDAEGVQDEDESSGMFAADRGDPSLQDQLEAGDLEQSGLIADLRGCLHRPRVEWASALGEVLAREEKNSPSASATLTTAWLCAVAVDYRSKGKPLAAGTVRYYFGLLAQRLIAHLPAELAETDGDELADIYREIVDSGASEQHAGRILRALRLFHLTARSRCADIPEVALPGFAAGSYAISARIISEGEYRAIREMTEDGSLALDPGAAVDLRALLVLAFRLGLRRSEAIGLRRDDFRWGTRPTLRIRNNRRKLKTGNARRQVPLSALDQAELGDLRALCTCRSGCDYVFFDSDPDQRDLENHAVVRNLSDALRRATGDGSVHLHNLRHATASLSALGMLAADAGVEAQAGAALWMTEAAGYSGRLEQAISGKLHRRAGRLSALSMMMGHGSERTTLEHYVHTMDLLLHFAAAGAAGQPANPREHARRGEVPVLTAMLGLSRSTRLPTHDRSRLLKRVMRISPARCIECERAATADAGSGSREAAPMAITDRLNMACLLDEADEAAPGYPKTQAQRDTAQAALGWIRSAMLRDLDVAVFLVRALTVRRIRGRDWSSMAPDGAAKFLARLQAAGIETAALDLRYVDMPPGQRKTSQRKVTDAEVAVLAKDGRGRVWIRLRDPRRGEIARRQRTQSSVSWVLERVRRVVDDERL